MHEGKTFLVVGRGPSFTEHVEEIAAVKRDVTIAANYTLWSDAEKAAVLPDYDFSVDSKPCQNKRPKSVKLVTVANTPAGMKARQGHAWAAFKHLGRKKWGDLKPGQPLPTSYNSGIGAVSLALFMGAKRVKVIGIDFTTGKNGGIHSQDTGKVKRGKGADQFKRNQGHVQTHALEQGKWASRHGVEIENLSTQGVIAWARQKTRIGAKGASKHVTKQVSIKVQGRHGDGRDGQDPVVFTLARTNRRVGSIYSAIERTPNCRLSEDPAKANIYLAINGKLRHGKRERVLGGQVSCAWMVDDVHWIDRHAAIGREFDLVFTPDRNALEVHGRHKSHYLPLAAGPEIFYPRPVPKEYRSDVLFLMAVHPTRGPMIEEVCSLLPKGVDVKVVGNSHVGNLSSKIWHKRQRVSGQEASMYYAGAKISVGIPRSEFGWHTANSQKIIESKLTTRAYQSAMCGAFHLTPFKADLPILFPCGGYGLYEAWDAQDCAKQIMHWIEHEEERLEQAERACAWARGHHGYWNRIQTIIQTCRQWLARSPDREAKPIAPVTVNTRPVLDETQEERDAELAGLMGISVEEVTSIDMARGPVKIVPSTRDLVPGAPEEYLSLYRDPPSELLLPALRRMMQTSARTRHKNLYDQLRRTHGKRVLDFGAGTGTHAIAALESGNTVSVLDAPGAFLEFTRRRIEARFPDKVSEVTFYEATSALPAGAFDLVICTNVLEHVFDPVGELKRIHAALAMRGVLHLAVSGTVHPEGGHFRESIEKWRARGPRFLDGHFKVVRPTVYRKVK